MPPAGFEPAIPDGERPLGSARLQMTLLICRKKIICKLMAKFIYTSLAFQEASALYPVRCENYRNRYFIQISVKP
jgi:hypothetical protein